MALLCTILLAIHTNAQASPTPAQALGWVHDPEVKCGGYYLDPPFVANLNPHTHLVEIASNQTLFSQRSTSILEGKVTISRYGQEIIANKAYLYRDPISGRLNSADLLGNVNLREPYHLMIAKKAHLDFHTHAKLLNDILYRTAIYSRPLSNFDTIPAEELKKSHKITALTAWGEASEFSQSEPSIDELYHASYSTCSPEHPSWWVQAKHIVLNKASGRGYATHARILVKGVPIFYTPYINFPIDGRRKTGFLWPRLGSSNKAGIFFEAPFYWNMATNHDMTLTPSYLSKRGFNIKDTYRYLTTSSDGKLVLSILPNDRAFSDFQIAQQGTFQSSTNPFTQAELNRLLSAGTTRHAVYFRDHTQWNEHWSGDIDFSHVSDDYYLQDFGTSLNEITQNQLLQEGDVYYKGKNWHLIGRLQAYQTLHPLNENNQIFQSQYQRLPQLVLEGDYPEQKWGMEYFITNELTRFDIHNTPGNATSMPVGQRLYTQPGVSLPLYWPYFYVVPRLQLNMTQYQLRNTQTTDNQHSFQRVLPIVDIASGLAFVRDIKWFHQDYQQTLEPQIYYTYVPFRSQQSLPIFDTTVNTLTYDQLFTYNRFSGIDRIGDANQLSLGLMTRFIDDVSSIQRVRLGVGEIMYFKNRQVTLCDNSGTTDCLTNSANPNNPANGDNFRRFSPLSGVLDYSVSANWRLLATAIWNPQTKTIDNQAIGLHYQPDGKHIINVGYNFARDQLVDIPSNNLKNTDFSFSWPLAYDISAVGRWSQDWNKEHFQSLLYGLQYDACCYAVRLVGGRIFTGITANNPNTYRYNTEFYIQVALKGLGNVGSGNPNALLSTVSGYQTDFEQDI